MESPHCQEDDDQFNHVRVYARLVTSDSPDFDTVFEGRMDELPVDPNQVVLPVFDVAFEGFSEEPSPTLEQLVSDELNESLLGDRELGRAVQRTNPDEIYNSPPYGQPTTQSVPVGDIAVAPSQEGLISMMSFDELIEQVN